MDDQGGWTLDGDAPARTIARQGFVHLAAAQLFAVTGLAPGSAARLRPAWDRLPLDAWLRDGGRYRRRRHGCWVHRRHQGLLERSAHRAHWQPIDYNALHGGIERMFEPIEAAVADDPAWAALLVSLGELFAASDAAAGREPPDRWYIEAHQFRIDTAGGVGRPTPEGAHRDGVDYVAVILVDRSEVRGGETRIFEAQGPHGMRFVMDEPWSAVLLDDARMIHETTPIQPDGARSHRDTLVLTYRRGGFQAPDRTG